MSISCTIDLLEGRMQLRQTTRRNGDACSAPGIRLARKCIEQCATVCAQSFLEARECSVHTRSTVACRYSSSSSTDQPPLTLRHPITGFYITASK